MTSPRTIAVLTTALCCGAAPAYGQKVVTITGEQACKSCSLSLERIAVIGSTDGPGALSVEAPSISRDARGRFYVYGGGATGPIDVFSSTGFYLRSLGRKGSGPGEYRTVSGLLALTADTLAVVDAELNRITMIAPDYTLIRTISIAGSGSKPVRSRAFPRQLVLNAADARRGDPLFVVDLGSGAKVRSFAAASDADLQAVPEGTLRNTAVDSRGEIWMSYLTRYLLERWNVDGTRTLSVRRQARWFPQERRPGAVQRGEPEPMIQAIDVDAQGRVWTLISVPDQRWEQAIQKLPTHRFPKVIDPLRHRDTVLEVLDVANQRVLISRRFDDPMLTLLPGPYLVQPVPDAEDRPTLRISRLVFRER
jgi:hypothetical protein